MIKVIDEQVCLINQENRHYIMVYKCLSYVPKRLLAENGGQHFNNEELQDYMMVFIFKKFVLGLFAEVMILKTVLKTKSNCVSFFKLSMLHL